MCSEVEFRSQVISRELYIHIYFVYFFKSPDLCIFFLCVWCFVLFFCRLFSWLSFCQNYYFYAINYGSWVTQKQTAFTLGQILRHNIKWYQFLLFVVKKSVFGLRRSRGSHLKRQEKKYTFDPWNNCFVWDLDFLRLRGVAVKMRCDTCEHALNKGVYNTRIYTSTLTYPRPTDLPFNMCARTRKCTLQACSPAPSLVRNNAKEAPQKAATTSPIQRRHHVVISREAMLEWNGFPKLTEEMAEGV